MPVCRNCGNNRLFGSSLISPAAPTANGPMTGIMADFQPGGELGTITQMTTDRKEASRAAARPREYFDTCLKCGSQDVDWD
ncbi:MAG TPA: hypothetical protein PKA10_17405 [Selenomonadales bacterium]|nr:hypothetical protein [Selenomonadales bacterium]